MVLSFWVGAVGDGQCVCVCLCGGGGLGQAWADSGGETEVYRASQGTDKTYWCFFFPKIV